jgi:hypothetical protein
MITLVCEFNTRAPDGTQLALLHDGRDFSDPAAAHLNLRSGVTILLRSIDGDFEVEAILSREFSRWLGREGREAWVARPIWSTIRYLDA